MVGLLCRRWRYSSQYPHRRQRRCTTPTATVQGRSHLSYVGLTSLADAPSRHTRAQILRAPTLPGLAACLVHWARGRGRSRLARCRPCADVFAILHQTALRATGLRRKLPLRFRFAFAKAAFANSFFKTTASLSQKRGLSRIVCGLRGLRLAHKRYKAGAGFALRCFAPPAASAVRCGATGLRGYRSLSAPLAVNAPLRLTSIARPMDAQCLILLRSACPA